MNLESRDIGSYSSLFVNQLGHLGHMPLSGKWMGWTLSVVFKLSSKRLEGVHGQKGEVGLISRHPIPIWGGLLLNVLYIWVPCEILFDNVSLQLQKFETIE